VFLGTSAIDKFDNFLCFFLTSRVVVVATRLLVTGARARSSLQALCPRPIGALPYPSHRTPVVSLHTAEWTLPSGPPVTI